MASSATVFFAGVGTVLGALGLGVAGGMLMTEVEPANKIQALAYDKNTQTQVRVVEPQQTRAAPVTPAVPDMSSAFVSVTPPATPILAEPASPSVAAPPPTVAAAPAEPAQRQEPLVEAQTTKAPTESKPSKASKNTTVAAAPPEPVQRQEPLVDAETTKIAPAETKPPKVSKKKEAKDRVVAERRKQRRGAPEEEYAEEDDEPSMTTAVEREAPHRAIFGLFRF